MATYPVEFHRRLEQKWATRIDQILTVAANATPPRDPNDDDFDVLCDGVVVGRIMKAAAVPVGMSWMWTLAFGYHEDRTATHGYEPGGRHGGVRQELAAGIACSLRADRMSALGASRKTFARSELYR